MRFSLFSRSRSFSAEREAPDSGLGPIAYRRNGDAILVFDSYAREGLRPGGQGPILFSALVPREPAFSEPVSIVAHGTGPALATPLGGKGRVEAAMSFYVEQGRRPYLSLLTRGPHEPVA